MNLNAVESAMLAAVGYDEQQRRLVVLFNSGKAYNYFEVPRQVYEDLMAAESMGRFMNDKVINVYPYSLFKGWEFKGRK